jgi:hypothetical protein
MHAVFNAFGTTLRGSNSQTANGHLLTLPLITLLSFFFLLAMFFSTDKTCAFPSFVVVVEI